MAGIGSIPRKLPRIALVGGRDTLRRLGVLMRHLAVGILDEPMTASVICPDTADISALPVPPLGVIRYCATRLPLLRTRLMSALAEQVRAADVSMLHAVDLDGLAVTTALAETLGLPYIASVYSLRSDVRAAESRCGGIIAASQPIVEVLLAARAAPPEQVHLIRPGVHQVREPTCFLRPERLPAIVAAAELQDVSLLSAVLESFARLKSLGRECAYFLVGAGPAEGRLRRQAERMGLMADLTFVDEQGPEQLGDILQAADIFISPVPTPRVDVQLLSAMAAGVPVLVAGAAAADFVVNQQTGLTFTPGERLELTGKLTYLLDDHDAATQLASRALALLREHHSPARMAQQTAELYRQVMTGKRAVPA